MKKEVYKIPNFDLPAPIRKRINDLVKLNINPTTINLITGEFSKASDETKENIGRYIARLIEVQNEILEKHYEDIKLNGGVLNLKQELNITKTKSNLLRIQQIFMKKDIEEDRINKHRMASAAINSEQTLENLNFRDAMFIDNSFSSKEDERKEWLKKISIQKTRIDNAISLEKSKLRKAKLLFMDSEKNNDFEKSEIIKEYIKKTVNRIKTILDAKKSYKNILDIPDEIINGEIDTGNSFKTNSDNSSNAFLKIKETMKKSTNNGTLNIDLKTFFEVPEFDEKKNLLTSDSSLLDKKFSNNSKEKNFHNNLDDDLIKLRDIKKPEGLSSNKKSLVKDLDDDWKEKVIQKIKKKSKAKDRKIEQVENDKRMIEEQLKQLKKDLKVEELRNLEMHRKKSIENTEKVIKRDRQKYETSFNILEKKWKASIISDFLSSKQKAFNVMTNIKLKAKKDVNNDENNN
ncbi:hypothetical protein SCORR_v1c03980 [Spiroplasma corruscae]|uniref:Uncharacterized protein n=1 Tax=Spiroplasma corruscae TaxID=216934 RepID=A0A222ENV2_9MOLU|nr:hypothetical protein [Spiroplasma corruscae]ASP28172.1 hypothetical protein SCORR_v1c03980 [Spiroplasma corruscae]